MTMTNDHLNEKLFWCALNGNVEEVRKAIIDGADVLYHQPLLLTTIGTAAATGIGTLGTGYGVAAVAEVGLASEGVGLLVGLSGLIYMPLVIGVAAGAALAIGGQYVKEYHHLNKGTPLHAAAYAGHIEVVQMLLENGSNPLAKDANDKTPFDIICNRSNANPINKDPILVLLTASLLPLPSAHVEGTSVEGESL